MDWRKEGSIFLKSLIYTSYGTIFYTIPIWLFAILYYFSNDLPTPFKLSVLATGFVFMTFWVLFVTKLGLDSIKEDEK